MKLKLGLVLVGSALAFAPQAMASTVFKNKPSSYEKLPEAKKGGTLFLSLSNNPKVMNPILSSDANSSSVEPFLWARLFTEDAATLAPLPFLAEGYTISKDRKSYTFKLQSIAKWEDGTPVTADDVRFTFDTMMNPKVDAAPLRAYWEGVTLEIKDSSTFTFTVKEPKFDTLRSLYLFQVVQKKQFAAEADYNKARGILQPVGNGPYKLKTFSRDQRVEFERVKDWWGNSIPHLKNRFNADRVVLRIVTDPNLEYERFVKGDLDIMEFPASAVELYAKKVLETDKGRFGKSEKDGKDMWSSEFINKAPRGYSYVGWNLKNPIFSSKKTRQALARLANYQEMIDKIYYGFQHQATSPFGSLTLNSDPSLRKPGKMLTYDLGKALELLKADGWADTNGDSILDKMIGGKKTDFKFTLKYNSNNPSRGKIAQVLKENFKKAGIEMEIRAMEWNAYLTDVDNRQFDALILAWTATPYPNPKQTWHTDAEKNQGSNFVSYSNPKVDALITKANLEFDLKKRAGILQEINRILYDDQPYMFLFEPRSMIAAFQKKVKAPVWAMEYDVSAPIDIYTFEQ
jgi:peptide/nickel transport system substrate-binding protein/microcin C transport system substrate-binding protein